MSDAFRASDYLSYNSETGVFTWIARYKTSHVIIGSNAGTLTKKGYTRIRVPTMGYVMAHRLAWWFHYQEWPENQIDHINGERSDNRIINLRQATNAQNQHNSQVRKDSKTGVKGVTWNAQRQAYVVQIHANKVKRYLGCFNDLETAARAYADAAIEMHGEYRRVA